MKVLIRPQPGKHPIPSSPPPSSPRKRAVRSIVVSLTITALLLSVAVGTYVTTALKQKSVTHAAPSNTAVTTYKNDLARTGQNTHEIILNTSNVNQSQFGKHIEYQVDGQVYAQPLFLPNVTIGGVTHNVAFVATEHDSLYAFDADSTSSTPTTTFLWHRSFINPPAITTVSSTDVSCTDITPEYGITGTPVIDTSTNTIYVVANTLENGVNTYRLHAIDLTTGNDKPNSPVLIKATSGTTFNAAKQMNRPGLLLLNGVVYIGWGSHCDNYPYNGWIMGYSASTYQQVTVFNVTHNGTFGAVWQAGQGLAADSAGNIYVMTGNGPFDANTGGPDYGDSFVKLSTTSGLKAIDYFAPFNQSCLNAGDIDLGSGGTLLLPTSHEMVGAGKEGRIYVVSRDFLGGYTADPNLNCATTEQNRTDIDKVIQELPTNTANGGLFGSPSYWNGPAGEFVYVVGVQDHAKAFQLTSGKLSTAPTSQSPEKFGYPGGDITVSSNGAAAGSGIAWTIAPTGTLYAYDATNLGTELYNTGQNASRDKLPGYAKFTVPTIANGEVFVGTSSTLDIFGLLSTSSTAPVISSLNPTSGLVGTSVTLTGSHFGTTQGTSIVSFGSTTASVTSWSDTSLVVKVPNSLAQGAVKVTVTVAGQISNSQTFTVTVASTAYNNTGISDDSNPQAADINGSHQSYSAQALQAANISPGSPVVVNGVTFIWPNVPSGVADNYKSVGQTIPVTPVSSATTLAFLGTALSASASGTATITYSDGSTQSFTLGFTHWTTKTPAYSNTLVATMAYYNTWTGRVSKPVYLFYAGVTLQAGKTVSSVTLPANIVHAQLHIFAIATK